MKNKLDLSPGILRQMRNMGYEEDELAVLFKSVEEVEEYLKTYAATHNPKAVRPADDEEEEDLTALTLSAEEAGIAEIIRHDENQKQLKAEAQVSVDDMRDVRKLLASLDEDEDETQN